MLRKSLLFVLTVWLSTTIVHAQYDPSFNHYWMMEPEFNPAATGNLQKLRIMGVYSMQMTGFTNAPRTMYAAADLPIYFLKNYHGIGAMFMNDEIGLFSHKRFSLQYSQQHRLWGGKISAGLQADLVSESFDGTKLDLEESNDPAFPTSKVDGTAFDMAVGIYYTARRWYAGLSMQHVLSPKVTLGQEQNKQNELKIDPTYYFTAGYNIKLRSPFITIHPSVLCKYDGTDFRADITGRLEYRHDKKCLYGGLGYSPSHSITAFVGGLFHGVNVGYAYEAYTSMPSLTSGNTHEIIISYQMDLNLYKKGKNLHKSVRFL